MSIEAYLECGLRQVRGRPDLEPTRPPLGLLYTLTLDTLRKAEAQCVGQGWRCKDGSTFDRDDFVLALSMAGWDARLKDICWVWNRATLEHTLARMREAA